MQSSENGLLQKMRSQHLSEDIIVRIFSDLIIAAGDTVSTVNLISVSSLLCLYRLFEYFLSFNDVLLYLEFTIILATAAIV